MKPFLFLLTVSFFVFIFSGCQNDNRHYDKIEQLIDSASVTGVAENAVKLVKRAGISLKVKNAEQGIKAISSLTQIHGGMITHQSFQSQEQNQKELKLSSDSLLVISATRPQASLTVRIPSQELEAFLFAVAELGYFTNNSEIVVDDRSLLYLENSLKQKARQNALVRPANRQKDSIGNLTALQVQDEAIQQFISNKAINADVAYSTINLSLVQNTVIRKEIIANYAMADYELPFGQRLTQSLSNGWQSFLSLLLFFSQLWIFILLGIVAFVAYKMYFHKRKLIG